MLATYRPHRVDLRDSRSTLSPMQDTGTGSATPASPLPQDRPPLADLSGSDAGIGMNNETLMRFSTWLAEQPELIDLGYVGSRNDHGQVSTLIWWAGPPTVAEERVIAEARTRGIQVVIERAKYSRGILDAAVRLIFDAEDEFAAVGFAVSGIGAVDLQHDGLRVYGYDLAASGEPLSRATVAAVEAVLATLPGLSELISVADVRVEHGQPPVWYAARSAGIV